MKHILSILLLLLFIPAMAQDKNKGSKENINTWLNSPQIQEWASKPELQAFISMFAKQIFVVNGSVQGAGAPLSLRIEDGQAMDKMLQIIEVRDSGSPLELSFFEKFEFGKGSSGKIVQCSHTFSMESFRTSEKVEISLDENAAVEFIIMQNEHNGAYHSTDFNVRLAQGAVLNMVFLCLVGILALKLMLLWLEVSLCSFLLQLSHKSWKC